MSNMSRKADKYGNIHFISLYGTILSRLAYTNDNKFLELYNKIFGPIIVLEILKNINKIAPENLKAEIIMISGCKDDQYSSDAYISGRFNGAMTKAFLESLKQSNYDVSYFDLLANMRQYLVQHDFTQLPQLSSSVKLTNESIFSAAKTNPPFLSV